MIRDIPYRKIKDNKKLNKPLIVFFLLIGVITITPIIQDGKVLTFLWIVFIICFHRRVINKNRILSRMWFLGLCYLFICFIYYVLGISSASLMYCMQPLPFFLPVYGLIVINSNRSEHQIKLLYYALTFFAIINIADGIRLSLLNPMGVAFQNLNEDLDPTGVNKLNIGGSMFVNMTLFLLNVLIMAYYNIEKKKDKILLAFYIFVVLWFIIMCSFKASVIVFAFVSILFQYVVHKGKRSTFMLAFVALIVFILLRIFLDDIIDIFIRVTGSDRLASRLLVFSSNSGAASAVGESTMNARSNLWLVSIESWLSNPFTFLFGIGDHNHLDYIDTASSGVGNHGDLFDVFARYGIIGGGILYTFLKLYYDYCIKNFGNYCRREIQVFFIIMILVGFTKKIISTEEAYVIFLVFPLALMYITSLKNHKYNGRNKFADREI